MKVHDADRLAGLGDHQRRDLRCIDDLQGLAGELIRAHRLRPAGHHRLDIELEHVGDTEVPADHRLRGALADGYVPGDSNGAYDYFVRDRDTGRIVPRGWAKSGRFGDN